MERMSKSLSLVLVMTALLLVTTGSSVLAQYQDRVILECPAAITNPATDTAVPVKVNYTIGNVPAGGFSLGFHYDSDIIEVDSISKIGTHLPQALFFTPTKIDLDSNTILAGYADFTGVMPIPAGDSGLAFTLWFTVPGGTTDHCVDIDSSFVPPAGQFIFAQTSGSITPAYIDCGTEDLTIGTCSGIPNEPPTAICQNVTVNADANCEAAVTAAQVDGGSFDTDGTIVSRTLSPAGPYPLGGTLVTLTVTDDKNATDQCQATITVNDATDPVLTCPGNIVVGNDAGQCGAIVNFAASATDNCDGSVAITYSQNPGTLFPKGTTTVNVTATDDTGNQDFCSFTVTVNDTEDPVAICPGDIDVSNDAGQCGALVNFSIDASDNCPGVSVDADYNSGDMFPVGTTTVTVTATDAVGNTNQCSFDITVTDTEDPVITCPGTQNYNNDPGECGALVTEIIGGSATDNCGPGQLLFNPGPGFFPVGTTTIEAIAIDASGNADSCFFDIVVNDTEIPTITCPDDIFVQESPGTGGRVVNFAATADDNCGIASLIYSQNPNTFFPIGETTVTVDVMDTHGNPNQCSFKITVIEINDPPVARDTTITSPEDATTAAQLQAYDPEGDALTYEIVDGPYNGTLPAFNVNTGAFSYLSNLNFNGADSLLFRAHDLTNPSNDAWVRIAVTPTNDAPVARDTSITTAEDTPINARAHGYDIDGDVITFSIDQPPTHGDLTAFNTTTGEFTYDPDENYNGPDEFTFEVSDVSKFAVAGTVSISVTPVNDAPTAEDLSIETDEDVETGDQASGSDVDGDDLTFEVYTPPSHGTITSWDENTGLFDYLPTQDYFGDDSFTYRANDGAKAYSAPATVSITIHPVNDDPEAPTKTYIVVKNTPGNLQLPGSDVDGDPLFWEILDGPFHGDVSGFNYETGEFTYTPDLDLEDVLDSLEYGVSDEELEKGYVTSWVYIQIVPPAFFKFDPDSLVFEVHEYDPAPAPELVDITSDHPSGDDFAWTVTEDADWLSLSPESDSTPSEVSFAVDHSGMLPGTYIAEVIFEVNLGEKEGGPQDTFLVYLIVDNPVSYDSVVVASETVEPGAEVTIAIWARNSAPTRGMEIPIRFDDLVLTYQYAEFADTRWSEAETYDYLSPVDPLLTLYADFHNIPFPPLARGAGVIAYLTFRANDGVAPGTVTSLILEASNPFYFTLDEEHGSEMVTPVFSPGTVTIDVTSDADDHDFVLPDEYSLAQNYPNPFNPETVIGYSLPQAAQVRLSVFNILGQSVIELVNEYQSAGEKRVVWDGTNRFGEKVDSGVYFYRITAGDFDLTRKMVLMK
ncbi:MAG: Ig-like domain-containing protein [bacterium]